MDSLGQGSLPNNSGGMQNAKQPEPAPAGDNDVKDGDFSRRDGSRGNINTPNSTRDKKIQTVNSKISKMTAAPKTSLA
jgi:hypothetical protein